MKTLREYLERAHPGANRKHLCFFAFFDMPFKEFQDENDSDNISEERIKYNAFMLTVKRRFNAEKYGQPSNAVLKKDSNAFMEWLWNYVQG